MTVRLFESEEDHQKLLPLTYTRAVGELRVGILTIAEKWSKLLNAEVTHQTVDYLQQKYEVDKDKKANLWIRANLLPNGKLLEQIKNLADDQALILKESIVVYKGAGFPLDTTMIETIKVDSENNQVEYPWDIFRLNGQEIRADYEIINRERISQKTDLRHTICFGDDIFIEEGARVKAATLNAENGPIYIGKNAEVQEGSLIRGPFALCEGSVVNMGAKIRGDSTIGPHSKVGGEVSNSVLIGYSNKGHDGFLGNSVLGEWCNLGADTNNSNLKNNYANIKMWDFGSGRFKDTGLQFCGLIMGDHSKCGINTMFNTGTSVGVSANIFGEGFPRNFIPSFSWGGNKGFTTYQLNKVFETAELVMSRRGKHLSAADKSILEYIFAETARYRNWEKTAQ